MHLIDWELIRRTELALIAQEKRVELKRLAEDYRLPDECAYWLKYAILACFGLVIALLVVSDCYKFCVQNGYCRKKKPESPFEKKKAAKKQNGTDDLTDEDFFRMVERNLRHDVDLHMYANNIIETSNSLEKV